MTDPFYAEAEAADYDGYWAGLDNKPRQCQDKYKEHADIWYAAYDEGFARYERSKQAFSSVGLSL